MPLLDHFRNPPAHPGAQWTNVNALWTAELVSWLNERLPAGEYTAVANVRLGTQIEADVAEFEASDSPSGNMPSFGPVPPPVATLEAVFPDIFEVQVQDWQGPFRLAGVIELVSPGNKKEVVERDAFLAKCAAYLAQGAGLVVVDIVTTRLFNFHNALMDRIGTPTAPRLDAGQATYIASYRPVRREGRPEIDVWPYAAGLGRPLPAGLLGLRQGPVVTVDLEATYTATLRKSKL